MFVVKADVYLSELKAHAVKMHDACRQAWEERARDGSFVRLATEPFFRCPADSVDFAVMERTAGAAVVEAARPLVGRVPPRARVDDATRTSGGRGHRRHAHRGTRGRPTPRGRRRSPPPHPRARGGAAQVVFFFGVGAGWREMGRSSAGAPAFRGPGFQTRVNGDQQSNHGRCFDLHATVAFSSLVAGV